MKWILASVMALAANCALGYSNGQSANPFRAYPPSCLSYPLIQGPTEGPKWTGRINLPLTDSNAGYETVTIALWRAACVGGKSAFLGAIARDPINLGKLPSPFFPMFKITQGSSSNVITRVAQEPNTVITTISYGDPVILAPGAIAFVFENSPAQNYPQIDYSQGFQIDLYFGSQLLLSGQIPTYDLAQYPSNNQSMPITGYNSGAYYDPAHGGEGMFVNVLETGSSYTLFASWFTFDQLGLPFWFVAQASFAPGEKQVVAQALYSTGGGFAGNFTPPLNRPSWGTVTFSFPDCNTMTFSYSGATDAQVKGPAGSGSRTWRRLGSINALTCN